MMQDEGVRDRIRQAEEFLDPSMPPLHLTFLSESDTNIHPPKMIHTREATGQTSR